MPDDTALRICEFEVSMKNFLHAFKTLSVRSCYDDVISGDYDDCFICLVYQAIDCMIIRTADHLKLISANTVQELIPFLPESL
eukprot:2032139-Ditylum_brightwellii.AAC.1